MQQVLQWNKAWEKPQLGAVRLQCLLGVASVSSLNQCKQLTHVDDLSRSLVKLLLADDCSADSDLCSSCTTVHEVEPVRCLHKHLKSR